MRPGDVVARLGGDEYAVLLERIDEPGGATDVAARILDELGPPFAVNGRDVSVAARANKPIGEKMIMNAAFLVSREKETAFDAKVKEVGALYDKLNFRYTGPWPPYNFVNIRLKLERAQDAE